MSSPRDRGRSKNELANILRLLEPPKRKKLLYLTILQILIGFLDLFGVAAIGALGALSVQGIQSHKAGNHVSAVLSYLGLSQLSFQRQVAFLGLFAAFILILKTLLSIYLTRKTFLFLSRESAILSGNLMGEFLSQNVVVAQEHASQETIYALTDGVKNIFLGVIATLSTLFADCIILIILSAGLLLIDPFVALATVLLFTLIGLLLYRILNVRAKIIGLEFGKLTVKRNQKILEILHSFRETIVRNRQQFYLEQIKELWFRVSDITAEINFQPYISKYVIETASVLGAVALAAFEFGSKSAVHAVATLAVFIAASSRIAPAALRIQQGLLTLKNSQGSSQITMALLASLANSKPLSESSKFIDFEHPGFIPAIEILSAKFIYPGKDAFSLKIMNLSIIPGSTVAIVGPSGSGKSTLVDLILGVISPTSGEIKISGVTPKEAAEKWSGAISYVPQSIFISSGTIRENISLGYPINLAKDNVIWDALAEANLREEIEQMSNNLDSQVGENGFKLSGGQRQRLGIARAFFSAPKILIFDEATSALDAQSEALVTKTITKKAGKATVIIVAHRLSTAREADLVVYMEKGNIITTGSFKQVRDSVPNFDAQAKLMGL